MICFQKHANSLLSRVNFYCGASAGALIASLLVLSPHSLETGLNQLYRLAEEVQNQRPFGALTPGFNMAQRLAKIVDDFLPEDIDRANGRLIISVTKQRDWSNRLISEYPSREYLLQCLNATCYVPLYSSSTPPTIDGERYIDGVYSNNLPVPDIPNVHTITISPFSGGAIIAPRDQSAFDWQMIMGQQRINVNIRNVMRGAQSLFPQSLERLRRLYRAGYYDAMLYLLRKGCFEREAPFASIVLLTMGIKDLSKVIADHSPSAIKTNEMKAYFGRRIAIDASMSLYQFLIAIRQDGAQLTTEEGETTSHLNGIFYRTIRMMDNGIRPIYVFDGKPPELKSIELDKRMERRAEAEKQHLEATERGDKADIDRFGRRLVKVTKEQSDECKHLLSLMGVPVVEAPCEAEAQCAELVRAGKAYATATEDMDALTFGSKILVRHMTFSEAKKMPIKEFSLERALKDWEISQDEFVDLCILLGCDYCATIKGIGPKKAFELIKKYKSIETILESIDQKKYAPPDSWLYKEARQLFLRPDTTPGEQFEFTWAEPKVQELVDYLCGQKGFNEDRIRSALDRLQKSRKMALQGRIDSFFKPQGTANKAITEETKKKRKAEEEEKATTNKKKSTVKKTKKK
ncbi:hypothetical protein niasHS_003442 [Heterodera schachtii]|uniref:Flap endonuclease 1 n=1 Tax=Heterodera schachtii TaxID=97005 RepID=A0ABD2KGI3_HETSC